MGDSSTSRRLPWVATGVGSLPGSNPGEAASIVAGETPQWPYLAELPARGPGADMVGRAMGLLAEVSSDFAVETSAGQWRRTRAPGRDLRRAAGFLRADFDAAEENLLGYQGPFTVSLAGPWSLASSVADGWGERALRDTGYVHDLCQAHAEACGTLVARARSAMPGAQVVVSIDEPALAAVHRGEIPFTSGFRRHRAVAHDELVRGLAGSRDAVRAAGGLVRLHTCARPVWSVVQGLSPDWLSLDVGLLTWDDNEHFGTWLESGRGTVWGVWPSDRAGAVDEQERAWRLVDGWLRRIGLSASTLRGSTAVSPACGLAGVTSQQALAALRGLRVVSGRLAEQE